MSGTDPVRLTHAKPGRVMQHPPRHWDHTEQKGC